MLHDIAKRDLIEHVPGGELILGLAGERIVNGPSFYAEFQTQAELTVNYQGQTIGRISSRWDPAIGGCLVLGGAKWAIERIDHRRRVIEVRPSPTGNAQSFDGKTGEVHTEIYRHMRQMLMADRLPGCPPT